MKPLPDPAPTAPRANAAISNRPERVELRPPGQVMRLERMGAFHQCRLSFMRQLLRRLKSEDWHFERTRFDIGPDGAGTALYCAHGPDRTYTLVAFAHDLADEDRSDRVIATAWDATFALFDGVPTPADVERLRDNVPLQEAGRVSQSELTLSRANRSARLWDHVVTSLAAGRQPDRSLIDQVGYLMRTTAVYGSGKFGAADRQTISDRPECVGPFQVEMLTVYLVRAFVVDLAEAMAKHASPSAVALDSDVRRALGIGNSTGLGMAPFLISHPLLVNNWIMARETGLARVRAIKEVQPDKRDDFVAALAGARRGVSTWHTQHGPQAAKIEQLAADLDELDDYVGSGALDREFGWNHLVLWSETALSVEGQELVVSLVLEPHAELVDELADTMHADESAVFAIDGSIQVAELRRRVRDIYGWSQEIDWTDASADARAWYVSADKLEPRLGERHREPVGPFEQPLQPARDAAVLLTAIQDLPAETTVATLLASHPEHRHTVRRVQIVAGAPYGEICDNTIDASMLPIDLLRAKLSFFGATHFDPRSDRWVRINMFRGAPLPDELADRDVDSWVYDRFGTR